MTKIFNNSIKKNSYFVGEVYMKRKSQIQYRIMWFLYIGVFAVLLMTSMSPVLTAIVPMKQSDFVVDHTIYDNFDIIVPDDYPTIQSAIDHATSGNEIFVRNGIYTENLKIDKMINLTGESWDYTIIDGQGKDHVVDIQADGVSIGGFTITNSKSDHAGIYVHTNHYQIIEFNIITANGYGIQFYSSNGNRITDNIIVENEKDGFYIEASHANEILRNEVKNNQQNGIAFSFASTFNTASDNHVESNGLASLQNTCCAALADGGFSVDQSSRSNIFEKNSITKNAVGVKIDGTTENNFIYSNDFVNNVETSALDSGVNNWDKDNIGNHWSDYAGEDQNGDGIGDTPYFIPGGNNNDSYPLVDEQKPNPPTITGPTELKLNQIGDFEIYTKNPIYDNVYYEIQWGLGREVDLTDEVSAIRGTTILKSWDKEKNLRIRVRSIAVSKATNEKLRSGWSTLHVLTVPLQQETLSSAIENEDPNESCIVKTNNINDKKQMLITFFTMFDEYHILQKLLKSYCTRILC